MSSGIELTNLKDLYPLEKCLHHEMKLIRHSFMVFVHII